MEQVLLVPQQVDLADQVAEAEMAELAELELLEKEMQAALATSKAVVAEVPEVLVAALAH
jgi:hypothetical protein